MKILLIFLILLLGFNFSALSQYFKVAKIKPETSLGVKNPNATYLFKIILKGNNTELEMRSYPISSQGKHYNQNDTLAMIAELLKFEGDTRICALPIKSYSAKTSQMYMGKGKRYSIQLEALFIINQLYFRDPFLYSPYPVLYNDGQKKFVTTRGKSFLNVYDSYRSWFKKIRQLGLAKSREQNLQPLDSLPEIRWYK